MLNSFENWSLSVYSRKPIEVALDFAKTSEAPVFDTIVKLSGLIDGYSLYLINNVKGKEDE